MEPTLTDVLLEEILLSESPRVRCEDNEEAIKDYRDAYLRHDRLPPPVIYQVLGVGFLVADGRHRVMAAAQADLRLIACVVRRGTAEECLACALGANSRHGLRRTNADKRMCCEKALKHWPQLSDRQVADLVHAGPDLVATIRGLLVCKGLISEHAQRLGADGKTRAVPVKAEIVAPQTQAKVEPMTAKRDKAVEIEHTEPPPVPKGLRSDTVPLILDAAKLLQELWDEHPSWHIPAFRRVLTQLKVVSEELQFEFPGFGQPKIAKLKFVPPTVEQVREWCRRDGLPDSHAQEFVSFYASKGWRVGKNPMVSAEQAFVRSRTWDSAKGNGEVKETPDAMARKTIARLVK